MGFDVDEELVEFFEGDSDSYSIELDDLHRAELVFLMTGVTMSAMNSARMGDQGVHDRKMALAEKIQDEIPDDVLSRMDELSLLVDANGGPSL